MKKILSAIGLIPLKAGIIIAFFIPGIFSIVSAQYVNLQVKEAYENEHSFASGQADSLNNLDSNNVKLKRHTLFLELGGTCIYYSIKYDLILKQWKKFSINYGVGFSILPVDNYRKINSYRDLRLPMQLSGLYGKNKNKLEFGVFITFIASGPSEYEKLYSDLNKTDYYLYEGIDIGYRYQNKQGGLFFKVNFLALYTDLGSFIPWPWIGIGIGHTFR